MLMSQLLCSQWNFKIAAAEPSLVYCQHTVTMVGDKYGDEADMESTSFILQDADSYRGELVGSD